MPGYDRTGPGGAGPRSGRGLGRCGRPDDGTASVEDTYQNDRAGWSAGRRGGGRGRGFGDGGRGRRQGFGTGRRAIDDLGGSEVRPRRRRAFLSRRIRELTEQLGKLNQLLSDDPPGSVPDQE
jgi:hypothetical protein